MKPLEIPTIARSFVWRHESGTYMKFTQDFRLMAKREPPDMPSARTKLIIEGLPPPRAGRNLF
jgi:hypothetical protein